MRLTMAMSCKQAQPPMLNIPDGGFNMDIFNPYNNKNKVVFILGATGAGKSRLSIDIATRFPSEIINSDKIQVYRGLDIVTNKITEKEKCGVPHHLLGVIDPDQDFTSHTFCDMASLAVGSISRRGQLPIIVGGSNSYIEALINDEQSKFRAKYECCFLWVDVSMKILESLVYDRVDQMVKSGMMDELKKMYDLNANYKRGIRRAIGVPEFHEYFTKEPFLDERKRKILLENAINEVKINTFKLAKRQVEKINRIYSANEFQVHRIDVTAVFEKRGRCVDEAWQKLVVGPGSLIVGEFLYDGGWNSEAAIRKVAMEIALTTTTY